jgi:hypothetical protein
MTTSILVWIWKFFLTLLLFFGALLWGISIVAVIWGFIDGFLPAIQKRQYTRAYLILLIIILTVTIILLSVKGKATYLVGYILPIGLLLLYIKKFIQLPYRRNNDFHNN